MKSSILYGNSTTLPSILGHFHRPRVDKLLSDLQDRHLILVTAGAGSGKTHAVSAFLQNSKARVFWFQLSELDNSVSRFWEEFLYIMEFQSKEAADRLEQLGFPETLLKYDMFLHILARDIYSREQVIFVFDDFHLIYDESVLRFIKNLITAKLENLCIIINTRTNLSFNISGLFTAGLAGKVTAEDLCFTPEETAEYLKHHDIVLPDKETAKVYDITKGWPLALYLVGLSIKKSGSVSKDPLIGAMPLIFEMIETELFSEYTPQMQNFLIRVSLLDSFPEGLVKTLADDDVKDVIEFMNNNMFISGNPYTGNYSFHHLFLEFLSGKQTHLSQAEITETYLRAAEWCAANDLKTEALAYYDKCGRHDEILNIMFNFGAATFSKTTAEFYINLIDKFPPELIKKNPAIHLHHAGLLYNNAEVYAALNELTEARRELEAMPRTKETGAVLGEIYCMLSLINLGMANYEFIEQLEKAGEYLPDGSVMINHNGRVLNTRYAIMLTSPAPGELDKMEEVMFRVMPCADRVMHGYGYGLDYLASAEAAYFTGDMKKAAKNAYEAVYRAREKQVIDIVSGGYFLLMRIEAANGNYEGVVSNLAQMKAYAEGSENKWNFNGMPDAADGWFNLLFGSTENVAGWLVDDALGGNVLAPYSMGIEKSIKARYLLRGGKYYELLAWIGQSEKPVRQYNILLVLLDILICKAIALHRVSDEQGALETLREAYEIAHGNNIIMPFIELGNDIRTVVYSAKRSGSGGIPEKWIDEIHTKAATYEKHLRNMRSQHNKTPGKTVNQGIKVTKREKEILGYLCQGLTNAEIASACFVSVSAVKKMLNNIYIKLGATNRADAVRTAITNGICK